MGLFSSKKALLPLFDGFVDYHCHILPGVDDGVQTMESSLKILSAYHKMGVRRVYLTPHIMEDVPNTPEGLTARFEELKAFLEEFGKGEEFPELGLASENMMDMLFEKRLEKGELLPLPGKRLLVETSYYNPPFNMRDLLFKVKSSGMTPVLAHPERYIYMSDSDYEELKGEDIVFQLNLSSLSGFYGSEARKKAESMLKKGYYELVGTDLHRWSVLEAYTKVLLPKTIWTKLENLVSESSKLM